jgi:hypothetical protein
MSDSDDPHQVVRSTAGKRKRPRSARYNDRHIEHLNLLLAQQRKQLDRLMAVQQVIAEDSDHVLRQRLDTQNYEARVASRNDRVNNITHNT